MRTATEKYNAVVEGSFNKAEFVRQMRQEFPQHITQWNGYDDTVQILKNRGVIFEAKKKQEKSILPLEDNLSLDSIDRGVDVELTTMGIDPTGVVTKEQYLQAKRKAVSNLQKNQTHYIDLIAKESPSVDKNDKYTETKRGAKDIDAKNQLKKATLKEEVDYSLDPYEDKKIITQQVIDLLKTEKGADNEVIKDFIRTHYEDVINLRDDQAILDEFDEFVSVNYEAPSDFMQETEVEEAMDDATMDAIKNYKPGSLSDEPHSFKPGDMFTTDFDYEGMLKAGLKIRLNTPVETMQAIYDSFEDVNYHRENAHLGEVIDAVKAGDKQSALDHLKMFRKEIKNTMSDIFEGAFPVRENDENYTPRSGAVVKERVGALQDFVSIIQDRAADSGFSEEEEAEEVVYAIGDHYGFGVDVLKGPQNEAKGKDHDGDGDVDGDDYKHAKDKAIKKAMGKKVNEAVKSIITKVLQEQVINEAATNELARIADDYADFQGMKGAILDLQNIVTDIEAYYDKTREKIQKIYDTLGEIRNEEGLKVGGFLAPAIEAAFVKDLRPVTKQGFTNGLSQPTVKTISRAEIDAARERGEIDETPLEPKQSVFTPNI
jgi:hypothetical protein